MEQWAYAELTAQADEHGESLIQFYLDQEDPETGDLMKLDVVDIGLKDNEIRVVLN